MPPETRRDTRSAVVAEYERTAREYVATVDGRPSASPGALQRLAGAVGEGARVLEIGSGPGWDADALEALGIDVRRTDAAKAFCEFQAGRGRRCDRLDLLADPVEGRYDGAMMLCVLQHFARDTVDGALQKLAQALEAGGALLLMSLEGEHDEADGHGAGDVDHEVRWTVAALDTRLARAGLAVVWEERRQGRGGSWRTLLARKR